MMNLSLCADPPPARFEAIARAKQGPRNQRLLDFKDTLESAYATYQSACPDLGAIPILPLSEQTREDLLHC